MNTGNTSSVWTKTAWCTPRSLWSNRAPTPCGRSSVCGCIALSAAGLTPGSSGRSQIYSASPIISPQICPFCPLNILLLLWSSFWFSWRCYFPSWFSFVVDKLFLFPLVCFLSCCLPPAKRYKNNVPIDSLSNAGKYKLESRYSVHSLEINR